MHKSVLAGAIALALLMIPGRTAAGAVITDQHFSVNDQVYGAVILGVQRVAQTFTVGQDGLLAGIGGQIYFTNAAPSPDVQISLMRVGLDGKPILNHTLFSATVPLSSFPIAPFDAPEASVPITSIALGGNLPVKAGDQLAIVAHRPGSGDVNVQWRAGFGYASGVLYSRSSATNNQWFAQRIDAGGNQYQTTDGGFTTQVRTSQVLRLTPTADAMAEDLSGSGTYTVNSTGSSVLVQSAPGLERRGIIEYDISDIPIGSEILGATLTLNLSTLTSGSPLVRVYAYAGDGAASAADALRTATLVGTSSVATTLEAFDVALDTTALESLIGNEYVGLLVLANSDASQVGFWSREGTALSPSSVEAPTLRLAYEVPEPAAIAAGGLLAALLLTRRGRRVQQ